ncbi:unnamed protein product, partial [Meganyctiphanes norvegica]
HPVTMKFQLWLVIVFAVLAVDSRYSSRSKPKNRVSSDGDQNPDTHQNRKIFPEEQDSIIVSLGNSTPKEPQNITEGHDFTDDTQKLKDLGNDELGPPISPEEFAKAHNDSTLTAPPPDGGNAMEESEENQGDIKLTPKQRAHMRKDLGNEELGPPISPEEFAKAHNDSTLTAPPPDGGNTMEESGEYQGNIKLTPKQRAYMRKFQDLGNDELGLPISSEEFAKARNDSTLTAPPPDGGKAMEESGEFQGDIKLTPKQRAHMRKERMCALCI